MGAGRPWRLGLLGALALAATCGVQASAQPQGRNAAAPEAVYEREVGCAAIAAAAIVREGRRATASEKERADAKAVVTDSERRAQASGRKLGFPPARVSDDIRRGRDGILAKIAGLGSDRVAIQREDQDLGRILIACVWVARSGR